MLGNIFANFRIGRACTLPVVVKRLKPFTALSGTVYRLASSMSDHTPVLFNVLEDWNEESVFPHISFDSNSIRTQTADSQVPNNDIDNNTDHNTGLTCVSVYIAGQQQEVVALDIHTLTTDARRRCCFVPCQCHWEVSRPSFLTQRTLLFIDF